MKANPGTASASHSAHTASNTCLRTKGVLVVHIVGASAIKARR